MFHPRRCRQPDPISIASPVIVSVVHGLIGSRHAAGAASRPAAQRPTCIQMHRMHQSSPAEPRSSRPNPLARPRPAQISRCCATEIEARAGENRIPARVASSRGPQFASLAVHVKGAATTTNHNHSFSKSGKARCPVCGGAAGKGACRTMLFHVHRCSLAAMYRTSDAVTPQAGTSLAGRLAFAAPAVRWAAGRELSSVRGCSSDVPKNT